MAAQHSPCTTEPGTETQRTLRGAAVQTAHSSSQPPANLATAGAMPELDASDEQAVQALHAALIPRAPLVVLTQASFGNLARLDCLVSSVLGPKGGRDGRGQAGIG